MLSCFPRGVLDEILNLIESVSEEFSSYSSIRYVFCYTAASATLFNKQLHILLLLNTIRSPKKICKRHHNFLLIELGLSDCTINSSRIIYTNVSKIIHVTYLAKKLVGFECNGIGNTGGEIAQTRRFCKK